MHDGPTWTEVALQALNVAQTVLLAYLASAVRKNGADLTEIKARAGRRRKTDENDESRP